MNQEANAVDAPILDVEAVIVDPASSNDLDTTPPAEDTEDQQDEKTQAEKTFTQAELDEIVKKSTAKLIRQRDKERAEKRVLDEEIRHLKPVYRPSGEPQEDAFENPKEYAKAYAKWNLEQINQAHHVEQIEKQKSEFKERVNEFREEMEDIPNFNYAKLTRLPLSDAAIDALLDSDMRTKLAVYLVNNKDDVDRISALSPARQASELGKLEAKLSAPVPKKISNAPAPITPVSGKGNVATDDLYDPKLQSNTDAWIAVFNKRRETARRR